MHLCHDRGEYLADMGDTCVPPCVLLWLSDGYWQFTQLSEVYCIIFHTGEAGSLAAFSALGPKSLMVDG